MTPEERRIGVATITDEIMNYAKTQGVVIWRKGTHVKAAIPKGVDHEWWLEKLTTYAPIIIWRLPSSPEALT